MIPITDTPAWKALEAHRREIDGLGLKDLFAADPDRFQSLSFDLPGLVLDVSKNRLTAETLALLMNLADAAGVESWRERLFSGETVNATEGRAVLHPALRDTSGLVAADVADDVAAVDARLEALVGEVRAGPVTDVINIGIGGSHLGPQLATRALAGGIDGPHVHYVANIDGCDLEPLLHRLDPATTLVLVASKTFTTAETMANAATARDWIAARLGEDAVADHFATLSTNTDAVTDFGISESSMFPFWDWVGGRFSLWSAIGLSTALAIGWEGFTEMRAGAHDMDRHFIEAPLARNLPVVLALVGVWNVNFQGHGARAVVPYDERLADLPAFLQQLEMESNGKAVTRDGAPVSTATAPVVFGLTGTGAQHAFHQLLHQGPNPIPVDFIAAARPGHGIAGRHDALIANMLAQAEALAFGTDGEADSHRVCPGDRPSTTILMDALGPHRLGLLLALFEHKVFVEGVIWGINSFDQFGVELGKKLAGPLSRDTAGGAVAGDYDSSTAGLLSRYRTWRDEAP